MGGTTTFTITFSPANTGKKAAMVTIPTDFPDDPTVSFMLSGTGVKGWRVVGSAGFSSGAVSDVSLAIDASDGTPYVAYIDQSLFNGYPVVKMLSSGSWNTLGDVGASSSGNYSTALHVMNDVPWLAYSYPNDGYPIRIQPFAANTWTQRYRTLYGSSPHQYISIQEDVSGFLHVALRDNTGTASGKATLLANDDGWYTASQGFTTNAVSFVSLGLRYSSGYVIPYIAFKDDVSGKANVNYGSSVNPYGDSDFSDGDADYTSLAINSNGVVYVAYSDGYRGGKVTVMENDDGENWTAVGSKGFSVGSASYVNLVCDVNETLYVAFRDDAISGKITVMKLE